MSISEDVLQGLDLGLRLRSRSPSLPRSRNLLSHLYPVLREIQPHAYLGRSRYGEQIARFLRYFDRDQLLILNSDHVKRDEKTAWARVTAFLGVDPGVPFRSPGSFPTSSVRSRRLQMWLRRAYGDGFDAAIESTRHPAPEATSARPLLDPLLRANLKARHPEMDPALRSELSRALAGSNAELTPHVDWDPSRWKEL